MNRQQGVALVLVLWMLTLLTVMAGSFALTMRRETAIMTGLKDQAQAQAIAEAGVVLAQWMLLSQPPELQWQADGRIYEVTYAGAIIRLRLLSEAGKIDINITDETQLLELMRYAPVDELKQQQLVDAILDWRDNDDEVRVNGAESNEYRLAGLRYAPTNQPFQSLTELQMVLGMDETVFNWLEPLLTVHSKQPVNLQKASREVLQVLNVDSAAIASMPAPAVELAPVPDNPFAAALQRAQQQQPQQQQAANEAVMIIAEVMLAADRTALLKAVVKPSPGGSRTFQILDWQTDASSWTSLFAADMDELLDTEYAQSRLDN